MIARRVRTSLLVLLALCMLPTALVSLIALDGARAAAQAPGPPPGVTVTTSVEPEEPRVGDRVTLTIEVDHPADLLISLVATPPRRPELEVIEVGLPSTLPGAGGSLRTSFTLVMAPFALGEVQVGVFTLQALREDGSASEFTSVAPTLRVRGTVRQGDTELRPLKPQATIAGAPPAWVRPALLGGVALASALLLAAAFLLVRRRVRRGAVALLPPLAPALAEDAARHQLDALRAQDLLATGDLEAYYGLLSLVVRAYLQERFAFRATALTSSELDRRMAAAGLDRWQIRLVSGLLERCDAAVYARRFPPLASADHDLTLAYEIVEFARPRREPASEAPAAVPA